MNLIPCKIIIEVQRSTEYTGRGVSFSGAASDVLTKRERGFKIREVEYSAKNNMIVYTFETNTNFTITNANIIKLIKNNWSYFNEITTHELKHQFDGIKSPLNPIMKKANYFGYHKNIGKSIQPINDLTIGLYYTNDFEGLTRNSQLFSVMMNGRIPQNEFKTFLLDSDIYKTLVKYKYITIDNIIIGLKNNYMSEVNSNLSNLEGVEEMNDDDKIIEIFKLLYIGIRNAKLEYLKKHLSNIVGGIKKLVDENLDFYNKELEKMDNADVMSYFKGKQLEINKNTDRQLKKLTKLYGMYTKEEEPIRERTY